MNWSSVKQNFSTKNPVIFRVELLPCLSQIRIRGLCSNKKMHLNNSNMWYEKPCFAHSKHSNYWALIYWIWLPWSQICIVTYIWIIKGSLVVVGEGLLSSRCCPGCGIKEPTCNSDFLTVSPWLGTSVSPETCQKHTFVGSLRHTFVSEAWKLVFTWTLQVTLMHTKVGEPLL